MGNEQKEGKYLSVIVLEDNDGDFVLIEDYLIEAYNTVKISRCETFDDFIQLKETKTDFNFDLILLDLHLPDISGILLIEKVLSIKLLVPVIILTGYAGLSLAKESLKLGVEDFLIKDEISPGILLKSIEFALSRKHFIYQIETERSNYENLFNLSPQPIWLVEEEGLKIIDANFSAIKKYGYSLEEFKKMSFFELHPESEHKIMINRLEGKANISEKKSLIHTLKNKEEIKVEIYSERVKGMLNDKRIIIQSNDVTETLNHIDTIEIQNKQLKNIAWTQSHEVRAPLARILGILNIIETLDEDFTELSFWLEQLKISSKEMDELVAKTVKETQTLNFKKKK